jgi:hypothetical protein
LFDSFVDVFHFNLLNPVKKYRVKEFVSDKKIGLVEYIFSNGSRVILPEPLRLIKPRAGLRVKTPDDVYDRIIRFVRANGLEDYFNWSEDGVMFKIIGDTLYYCGSGRIRIDCVPNERRTLFYIRSYDRIVRLSRIRTTNDVEEIVFRLDELRRRRSKR